MIRSFSLIMFLSCASAVVAQHPQLAPAPIAPAPVSSVEPHAAVQPSASGSWIDTSNRATVQSSYLTVYAPTSGVPMGWTGSVAGDIPGTTAQAYQNAVAARINWLRSMAGVPPTIIFNPTWSTEDQAAALMFSANNQISHSPPSTWIDYSSAGATAAANSNICLYSGSGWTDSGCIALYIMDFGAGNEEAGHRRWLLYPQTQSMGTGDVPVNGAYSGGNAIWVFDGNYGGPRPATRNTYVAWPPPGYVPYQVVFPRWSFSYPGADFTSATVTMTRNGSSVPVQLEPLANGYGDNTLVWVTDNQDPNSYFTPIAPASDTTDSVTVSNVMIGGSPQTFTYAVTVFDPGQSSTCTYTIDHSSQSFPAAGGSDTVAVSAASACAWIAASNVTWISINSGSSGSGSGAVSYSVSPNAGSQSRTGTLTIEGQTFTVTQTGTAPPPPSGLRFVPVPPCRIADTRNANGAFGGPYLSGGTPRNFTIPSSACGIPSSAQAYSINATAVPLGSLQYLTVWPAGQTQPTVSTLNSTDGRIKANAAIVPAGTGGAISVFATDNTNLVLDIDGYFVPSTNSSALAFYPLPPCRVADTRLSTSALGGPSLNAGGSRSFPVLSSGCNIPATAQAYSLNVTAVPHGTLSYLTTWPVGRAQPLVSTLNAPTGTVTANAAVVPAGTNGNISVYVSDAADVILDVNGYFAPPVTGGLSLYPVTPCRVLDTRSSSGQFSGTLPVNVSGSCGVPYAAQGYVLNATVVPQGSLNYLTLWPDAEGQPGVSTLNALDAATTSNMAIVPTIDGYIDAFAANPTQLIFDISAYFAP